MESLPGHTLQDRLAAGPLAPRAALRAAAEVAADLAAAHAAGVVHGAVEPSYVTLTPAGAKLSDFGVAAGHPEPSADVYALGLLIFQSLTGRRPGPPDGSEPEALPYISGVGPEVEDVYARCVARDPAARPTAGEVAAVLRAAAGIVTLADDMTDVDLIPVPIPADDIPAVDADRPRRRGAVLALAGLVVLALVALAVTVWWPGGQPARGSEPSIATGTGPGPVVVASGDPATPGTAATPGATGTFDPAAPTSGPTPGAPVGPTPSPSVVIPSGGSPVDSPTSPPGTPPATSTVTSSPPPGLLVTSTGGTIVVACVGSLALIALATPTAGYRLGGYKPGPATQVEAVFTISGHRSEIDATCKNGLATPTVKESSTN